MRSKNIKSKSWRRIITANDIIKIIKTQLFGGWFSISSNQNQSKTNPPETTVFPNPLCRGCVFRCQYGTLLCGRNLDIGVIHFSGSHVTKKFCRLRPRSYWDATAFQRIALAQADFRKHVPLGRGLLGRLMGRGVGFWGQKGPQASSSKLYNNLIVIYCSVEFYM